MPGEENEGRSEFVLPLGLLVAGGACPLSGIGPRLPSLLSLFVDGFLPNICDRGDNGGASRFRGFEEMVRPGRRVSGSTLSPSTPCLRIGNVPALWRDSPTGASTPRPDAGVESLSSRCMLVLRRFGLRVTTAPISVFPALPPPAMLPAAGCSSAMVNHSMKTWEVHIRNDSGRA
jgi:hypothetical protein